MGARWFRDQAQQQGDRIYLVDFGSFLVNSTILPASVKAPTSLDEILDWAESTNKMVKETEHLPEIRFSPCVKREMVDTEWKNLDAVTQKHVSKFPQRRAHDLALFYESSVRTRAKKDRDPLPARVLTLFVFY